LDEIQAFAASALPAMLLKLQAVLAPGFTAWGFLLRGLSSYASLAPASSVCIASAFNGSFPDLGLVDVEPSQ